MFLKKLFSSIGDVLRNPLKLLPTLVLGIAWILLGFLGACVKEMPQYLRIASFFTFAQGGLYGGALAAVGGIFGKVLVAAFLNALILPIFDGKLPFSGLGKGLKGLFTGAAMQGISDVSQYLGGLGGALILYGFMNSRQSLQESLVGIVAVFLLLDNIGKKNGLITSLVFDILKFLSGGRTPGSAACRRLLSGLTFGFALAVGLSALPYRPCVLLGIPLLLLAFIFSLFKKRKRKMPRGAAMILALMIGAGSVLSSCILSFSIMSYAAGDRWVDPYSEFSVDSIFKLLPKLKDSGAEMIKVTPYVYNNLGNPVELAYPETFSIDLRNGAKTEYTLNIDESNPVDGGYAFYEVKLTFTGDTGSSCLFKVASEWTEYAVSDGRILTQGDIETCTVYDNSGFESFLHDKKCIKIDCGIPYGIEFYPEQVYLTLNSDDDGPSDGDLSGSYDLVLKNLDGKKVSDITLLVSMKGSRLTVTITGDGGIAKAAHTIEGSLMSGTSTFYGESYGLEGGLENWDGNTTGLYLTFDTTRKPYEVTGSWMLTNLDHENLEVWMLGPDLPDLPDMTMPDSTEDAALPDEPKEEDAAPDKEQEEEADEPREQESEDTEPAMQDPRDGDFPWNILPSGPLGDIIRRFLEGDDTVDVHRAEDGSIAISFVGATVAAIAGSAAGAGGAAGAGAGMGAAEGPAAGSDGPDLDRFITKDDDGDINVRDPATGEKNVYVSNGDGTYTNPLSGATYTEGELKSHVASRLENSDLIRQDQQTARNAIESQRQANQQLSQDGREYLQQKHEDEARLNREIQLDHMWQKYGGERGDEKSIRQAMAQQQGKNVERQQRDQAYADKMDNIVKGLEVTQAAADIGVDVLATVTGQQGIKTAYTVGKNFASRMSDAYVNNKDMQGAIAMAGFDSLIDIGLDKAENAGFHITGNAAGDFMKNTLENLNNGDDWNKNWDKALVTGAAKGTIAKVGNALSGPQAAHTQQQLGNDLNMIKNAAKNGAPEKTLDTLRQMRLISYVNNVNAEKAVNAVVTAGVDAGKLAADAAKDALSDD